MDAGKGDGFMENSIEEADSEAGRGLWLGGEAVVRRYPRRRDMEFSLTHSITGLLALALGLGCAGGIWLGYQLCARKNRNARD
ncbi:MAG: hypothetical protein AB7V39_19750 [Nitrospiraceae bacterium]